MMIKMKKIIAIAFFIAMFPLNTFAAFSDVPASHQNYEAINYVQAENIVKGYEDGTYKPDQKINRAEFTKIIVEAIVGQEPLEHAGACFPDVVSGMWFYPYVCYAERIGFIGGYPDGTFKPAENINFVEAAKIIAIAYEYGSEAGSDVWYRPYVEALGTRMAIPTSIQTFEHELTRGDMAEIIYRLKANIKNKESQTYATLAGLPTEEIDTTAEDIEESKTPETVDETENETDLETPEGTPVITTLKTGQFSGLDGQNVEGSVSIVDDNGQLKVILEEDFGSQSGPDLQVFLSDVASISNSSQLKTNLGLLQSFSGRQEYLIPADVNYDIKSVTIHCVDFDHLFGSANVQ